VLGKSFYPLIIRTFLSSDQQLTFITSHPFDTIKVRLQTAPKSQFSGPIDCLLQTIRKEGINGLYKGATPPLLGCICMDSLMLGSLTLYRRLLNEHVFQPLNASSHSTRSTSRSREEKNAELPTLGHALAGTGAGWTVSFLAAPIEHIKARLQIQYQFTKHQRLYTGPWDCASKVVHNHGFSALWHGLSATLLFRSFFFVWWGSYNALTLHLKNTTDLSTPAVNFWAGGFSAQCFWLAAYPSDVVKQRIMTDGLGSKHGGGERRFLKWRDAAQTIWREGGWKGYWRGFAPCFLRAFPANATALLAFEAVMRGLD
jgi:solute carrier family 25 (mitochondrial carnitine/acylcarnitine transporter), member 20/29